MTRNGIVLNLNCLLIELFLVRFCCDVHFFMCLKLIVIMHALCAFVTTKLFGVT